METEERDFKIRQLRLMLAKLQTYSDGVAALRALVDDLGALNDALANSSPWWRHRFEPQLNGLDVVYAMIDDSGRTGMDDTDRKIVAQAIAELLRIVEAEIREMAD